MHEDLQQIDALVVELLSTIRSNPELRGRTVLPVIGAVLCARAEGVPPQEVVARAGADPELDQQLREWAKVGLASLVALTEHDRARVRADATWALGQVGESPQSLGMVRRDQLPPGGQLAQADVLARWEESAARLDAVVAAVWQG